MKNPRIYSKNNNLVFHPFLPVDEPGFTDRCKYYYKHYGATMRYVVKYLGNHQYGVIDTSAPKHVVQDQPYGHVLLWTNNGSQPAKIAANALNDFGREKLYSSHQMKKKIREVLYVALISFGLFNLLLIAIIKYILELQK